MFGNRYQAKSHDNCLLTVLETNVWEIENKRLMNSVCPTCIERVFGKGKKQKADDRCLLIMLKTRVSESG